MTDVQSELYLSDQPAFVGDRPMDQQLLKACSTGDLRLFMNLINDQPDPDMLFSVTPKGNNCLHIAVMSGHHNIAEEIWSRAPSLFSSTNKDGETPLMAALMAANDTLAYKMVSAASHLLRPDMEEGQPFNKMLLKIDRRGDNVLHHDIRNGFEDLSLVLFDIEPRLLIHINRIRESPISIAARKNLNFLALAVPASVTSWLLMKACSPNDLDIWGHFINHPELFSESVTPLGNNCLHIAALLGHTEFALHAINKAPSLLSHTNTDGETPLITAIMAANHKLASYMLTFASDQMYTLNEMLLKIDKNKDNALHHAIRNSFEELAVQLLDKEPGLSKQANKTGESPMHMSARKGYSEVVKRLLQIPDSIDCGPRGSSALHAAAKAGYTGHTPFLLAAEKGFVPIAKVIISFCLESAYINNNRSENALHLAIRLCKQDFVDFILKTPQLHRLINQVGGNCDLPLHHAARGCNPNILRSLLSHKRQDFTAPNYENFNAVDIVCKQDEFVKTLQWNEVFSLLSHAIPSAWWQVTGDEAKKKGLEYEVAKKALQKQTSNTPVVAALLATITFAAAFTLPGGLSTDPSDIGLPTFARKAAFQAFLIFDTIAMCSSLAVAFLSILTPWYWDFEFLVNYSLQGNNGPTHVVCLRGYCSGIRYRFVHGYGTQELVACDTRTGTLLHPSFPLQDHR
ncbi:ankyrin repeat family protein [Rhynchospora pubera]|uniref:Ankyrin repeat family protein n=1 Tax=Rhynchospora pubera TaxID=906938 RepID=A0AAV8DMC3_9POAL|nr:ankyrin repeat family protein [Rhynchospora pubera]